MSGSDVVRGWAQDVRRFAGEAPERGATAARSKVLDRLRSDTGGDGRLSNYKGGAAAVTVDGRRGEASVEASGSMGLWSMLEHGTTAHAVRSRRPGGYLRTPYGPRRMVQVSGMAARHTWTRGAAAGLVDAERAIDQAFEEIG